MKKILLAVFLCFSLVALVQAKLLITEVAPVGCHEFNNDWIEIQNTGNSNEIIDTDYVLEFSNGDTIALLASGTITVAPNEIIVVHFTAGITDTDIDDNNPGFWDIYAGNTRTLSARYETIALKEDATNYLDAIYYKVSNESFTDSGPANLVAEDQWDTDTRPVYYYIGGGLQRNGNVDTDSALDWKNVSLNELNPGKTNLKDLEAEPIEMTQNYPNPFNKSKTNHTTIKVFLPKAGKLTLRIYTISGDIIKTLLLEEETAKGFHEFQWIGDNDHDTLVQSGNYYIAINFEGKKRVKKMTFIR